MTAAPGRPRWPSACQEPRGKRPLTPCHIPSHRRPFQSHPCHVVSGSYHAPVRWAKAERGKMLQNVADTENSSPPDEQDRSAEDLPAPADSPHADEPVRLTHRQITALPYLLSSGTVAEGSKLAGISRTTFYRWMEDEAFRDPVRGTPGRRPELRLRRAARPHPQRCPRPRANARRPIVRH